MYQVEIRCNRQWYCVGRTYQTRESADGAVASLRKENRCMRDTDFRVTPVSEDEYVTLDSVLGRGRHDDDSGVDLGAAGRLPPEYPGPNLA